MRSKHLSWACRIHAKVGREPFRRVQVAIKLGVSIGSFENITAEMKEAGALETIGLNHGMRWQLTRKICEEITG